MEILISIASTMDVEAYCLAMYRYKGRLDTAMIFCCFCRFIGGAAPFLVSHSAANALQQMLPS
jgi:hypothetical protein